MLEYLVDLHRVSVGYWAGRSLGLLNDWGGNVYVCEISPISCGDLSSSTSDMLYSGD